MSKITSAILVLLLALFVYWWKVYEPSEDVFVNTFYGHLKGFTGVSRGGRTFSSFRAIRYAKAPVGDLRFEPPVEYGKWEGTYDGTGSIPMCPQIDFLWKANAGTEDCLVVNVYTPKVSFKNKDKLDKLPVLVFIHGGHFQYGASDVFHPHYFMDEDAVLVTINYRIGALGFLNTGDDLITGNMGLKDQLAALRWVQNAISAFGGDPEKVTIFGESAGAASVHYLTLYSKEKLFRNAISQSGNTLCPWAMEHKPQEQSRRLGQRLNCPIESSQALIKCLKGKSPGEIVESQKEILDIFHVASAIYLPTIETPTSSEKKKGALITVSPQKVIESGDWRKVDWINGVVSHEGSIRAPLIINVEPWLEKVNTQWTKVAPGLLLLDTNTTPKALEDVWKFYFGPKKALTEEDLFALTDLYSDRTFFGCTQRALQLTAKHASTYGYYLDYATGKGLAQALVASRGKLGSVVELLLLMAKGFVGIDGPNFGVGHADDLQQFFKMIPVWDINKDTEHYAMSKELIKAWVSFARDGKPSKIFGKEWEKVDPKGPVKYLRLNKKPEMIEAPFKDRLHIWDGIKDLNTN